MTSRKPPKIKVFLGAFVNQTNAQNLSCRALARYMDKERFEVYTLEINHGNLPRLREPGVKIFNCRFPVKLSGPLGFLWGFWKADVVYLPRALFLGMQQRLIRLLRVRSFKTVRNVIDDESLTSAMSQVVNTVGNDIGKAYSFVDEVYAMTRYMAHFNEEKWALKSEETTLLPPNDFRKYVEQRRQRSSVHRVIFVGNDWKRKGLSDFISLANAYPQLEFDIVGRGNFEEYKQQIKENNVTAHGLVVENELVELVKGADLMFLPSRSEGLPRVWLEALANGLPSMLYYGYGMEQFITTGKDGVLTQRLEEVKKAVEEFINAPEKLSEMSKRCMQYADDFAPETLTAAYEEVIEKLYHKKQARA